MNTGSVVGLMLLMKAQEAWILVLTLLGYVRQIVPVSQFSADGGPLEYQLQEAGTWALFFTSGSPLLRSGPGTAVSLHKHL